jgi:uncharacterized protein YdaU (DUF1376 family)
MAQFPGLMLWTDAWVADTHHLSRDVRGAYMDLIIKMWRTPGCRVPNDDAWLARHMLMTADEVVEVLRPIIREFCQTDGNWIFQKRLQKEFLRAARIQHAQSMRAKSGWKKRVSLNKQSESVPAKSAWQKKKPSVGAMHPDQISKRESFLSRAREDDEPEQGVAEKKAGKISAELLHLVVAKRSTSEE